MEPPLRCASLDEWRGRTKSTFLPRASKHWIRSSTFRCWGQGRPEMCALQVGNTGRSRPRDHFRRTTVAPKESFELLFARVQTPRYVPDNVRTFIERSSLLFQVRRRNPAPFCFEHRDQRTVVGGIRAGQTPRKGTPTEEEVRGSET
jgi:hypothetical protein